MCVYAIAYAFVCVRVCASASACVCLCVRVRASTSACVCLCIIAYMHVHAHTCSHAQAYKYTYSLVQKRQGTGDRGHRHLAQLCSRSCCPPGLPFCITHSLPALSPSTPRRERLSLPLSPPSLPTWFLVHGHLRAHGHEDTRAAATGSRGAKEYRSNRTLQSSGRDLHVGLFYREHIL